MALRGSKEEVFGSGGVVFGAVGFLGERVLGFGVGLEAEGGLELLGGLGEGGEFVVELGDLGFEEGFEVF